MGQHWRAHRLSYTLTHGEIPDSQVLLHSCDNPACVNPDHLTPDTQAANMQDKCQKDRHVYGERHCNAKLTAAKVKRIRKRYAMGGISFAKLAKIFGVCKRTIEMVVKRITWRHV